MRIQPVRTNENSFKGLHLDKYTRSCEGSRYFLNYDALRECADKYEVLIKRRSKINGGLCLLPTVATLACTIPNLPALMALGITAGVGYLASLGIKMFNNRDGVPWHKHQFTIQIGKTIKENLAGKKYLSGIKTDKIIWNDTYNSLEWGYIDSNFPIDLIIGSVEDIRKQKMDIFSEIMSKYNDKTLYDINDIYKILEDSEINEYFKDGSCFNLPIDNRGNTLLTKFFDIVPTDGDQKKYDAVINKMKTMPEINYNQKDSYGISILEKILNSENEKALDLVKNFKFRYDKSLDYAYSNIENPVIKNKASRLDIEFNCFEALRLQSREAFTKSLEELNSPLCNNKEEMIDRIRNFAEQNCSRDFYVNVVYPNIIYQMAKNAATQNKSSSLDIAVNACYEAIIMESKEAFAISLKELISQLGEKDKEEMLIKIKNFARHTCSRDFLIKGVYASIIAMDIKDERNRIKKAG